MSFGAPARSLGFWHPHHPASTREQSSTPGQEQAAHSRPADARPGGDRWLAPNAWFSLLVCLSGEQPHVKRENTPPSKTWLFSRRHKGWAANSLSPLATLGRRHGAQQACASFRPLAGTASPGPQTRWLFWSLCWGWRQGRPRAWRIDSPRPLHPAPGGLWLSPPGPSLDSCFPPEEPHSGV